MKTFMAKLIGSLKLLTVVAAIVVLAFAFTHYYSYIFAKTVVGTIESVERVELNVALMQGVTADEKVSSQLYSFAVGIKDKNTGEIVTSSAEDRQWAVARSGQCAEAKFYPYPPWKFDKAGTYFGARLLKLHDCEQP